PRGVGLDLPLTAAAYETASRRCALLLPEAPAAAQALLTAYPSARLPEDDLRGALLVTRTSELGPELQASLRVVGALSLGLLVFLVREGAEDPEHTDALEQALRASLNELGLAGDEVWIRRGEASLGAEALAALGDALNEEIPLGAGGQGPLPLLGISAQGGGE